MSNKHLGSNFNSFLEEENILAELEIKAVKRVIALQIKTAMNNKNLSKVQMASLMHTSRASLDRLLDPDNNGLTLSTLEKAVAAMGGKLQLSVTFPEGDGAKQAQC
jgi:antitoxin HicB